MTYKLPEFEHLAKLARENPAQLEDIRLRSVEAIIKAAPEQMQHRLRGIQFRVDCYRRIHKTPLGACMEISKLMYDSLHQLNGVLNKGIMPIDTCAQTGTANVLAFRKPSD